MKRKRKQYDFERFDNNFRIIRKVNRRQSPTIVQARIALVFSNLPPTRHHLAIRLNRHSPRPLLLLPLDRSSSILARNFTKKYGRENRYQLETVKDIIFDVRTGRIDNDIPVNHDVRRFSFPRSSLINGWKLDGGVVALVLTRQTRDYQYRRTINCKHNVRNIYTKCLLFDKCLGAVRVINCLTYSTRRIR